MADGLTKYYLCCNIYASRLALCYNDLVHFCNRGSMSNVSFSKRCKDRESQLPNSNRGRVRCSLLQPAAAPVVSPCTQKCEPCSGCNCAAACP
uniref:4Fe-4S ferredoxin-type domain-containing protein n=1 Tax=Oryza glumipatula TaxID=40148 RepID=A0A0E0BL38_9ORYZ